MKSVSEIEQPEKTAVSIITPPKVTINVLKAAKEKGVQSVWLQPGTFNEEVRISISASSLRFHRLFNFPILNLSTLREHSARGALLVRSIRRPASDISPATPGFKTKGQG